MYFPKEEMKVNKFHLVVIPKNRDYMSRFGSVIPAGAFSGEQESHQPGNKVDDLEYWSKYAEQKAREADKQ